VVCAHHAHACTYIFEWLIPNTWNYQQFKAKFYNRLLLAFHDGESPLQLKFALILKDYDKGLFDKPPFFSFFCMFFLLKIYILTNNSKHKILKIIFTFTLRYNTLLNKNKNSTLLKTCINKWARSITLIYIEAEYLIATCYVYASIFCPKLSTEANVTMELMHFLVE
jgi:hypothetical protein